MRALFCSLSSSGFVFPLIGIGRQLVDAGHQVAYVVGPHFSEVLAREGLYRIPRGTKDGQSFEVKSWADPLNVAMQLKHIEYGLQLFEPDVIVATHLTYGAIIAAEREGLPLCVIGGVQYLFPPLSNCEVPLFHRVYNRNETNRLYNEVVRPRLGLHSIPWNEASPGIYGDALLLRSIPSLTNNEILPDLVHLVGDCSWEPDTQDQDLLRWLESSKKPCVYVQLGRNFDAPSNWPVVRKCLLKLGYRAAVSTERFDTGAMSESDDNFFLRPYVPQGQVIPFCEVVLTTGHPTAVLGALTHAKPLILLPNGSGTYDLAETLKHLAIADVIDGRSLDVASLATAIRSVEHNPILDSIKSEFEEYRGSAVRTLVSVSEKVSSRSESRSKSEATS